MVLRRAILANFDARLRLYTLTRNYWLGTALKL